MTPLAEIGTLWIGGRLSFLERLCLKSFVDAGHPVTLYAYGRIENPPEGVELRDAREVWDDDRILIHEERGSPAIHSDVFRVKMIRKTGKIWADTDAYCLRPFAPTDGYLLGRQYRRSINNGVLGLPAASPALAAFDDFLATRGAFPPWWTAEERTSYQAAHGAPDFARMRWGTTGPIGLTWFLGQSGEDALALAPHVLYPLPQNRKGLPLRAPRHAEAHIRDDTLSVHFYGSWLRRRLQEAPVDPGSYLGKLGAKHGVALDPPAAAPAASPPALSAPALSAPAATPAPPAAPVAKAAAAVSPAGFPTGRRRRGAFALSMIFDLLILAAGPARPKYVQVGANDGQLADPLFERTRAGAFRALLLEPSPRYFAALADRYAGRTDVEVVNVGVSSEAGVLPLHQLAAAHEPAFPAWARGCASLHREEIVAVLSRVRPVTPEMIETVAAPMQRLDRILEDHGAEDADLLVVDVEGHEAAVFDSFSLAAFAPKAILYEHAHLDAATRQDLGGRLRAAGYRLFPLAADSFALRSDWLPPTIAASLRELGFVEESGNLP